MRNHTSQIQRRAMLQFAAAAAATGLLSAKRPRVDAAKPKPTGKPGDFDFLTGKWKIANKWLNEGKWEEFEGEATVYGILGGIASIEELRIPARKFSGMGLRLLDRENKLWADFFVNADSGVLVPPPAWGSFVDGVGTWDSDDMDGEKKIIVRGAWDEITKTSCRWYQAASHDDGKTWEQSWVMRWTRK